MKCLFSTTEKDQIDEAESTSDLRPGVDGGIETRYINRNPIEFGSAFSWHRVCDHNRLSHLLPTSGKAEQNGDELTVEISAVAEGDEGGGGRRGEEREVRRLEMSTKEARANSETSGRRRRREFALRDH